MAAQATFDLPEDLALVECELLVVGYIDKEGNRSYYVRARGDSPATTYLGLTVVAQQDIWSWQFKDPEE